MPNTIFHKYAILVLLFCLVPGPALAEVSIGFVSLGRLMEEAPQAKAVSNRIESEFAPREQQLKELQRQIQKMEDKLALDGPVMSDADRLERGRDVRNKKRDLKRIQEEFSEDLNIRRSEELSQLQQDLAEAVEALAKDEDYDVIFEAGVAFVNPRIDITDKVLDRLRRNWKGGN